MNGKKERKKKKKRMTTHIQSDLELSAYDKCMNGMTNSHTFQFNYKHRKLY